MSRKVEFYTITIYQNGVKTDYSIMNLFRNIKINLLESENNTDRTRKFDGRKIRLFSYYVSHNNNQIVLPFGRDKGTNKPYGVDKKDRLEEIPRDLYDVNSLGYDSEYNIMLYTTNQNGPTIKNVEQYLNSCIGSAAGVNLKIEPIEYNTGIEKVRNAELVKSIIFSLDLGQSLNAYYNSQIDDNTRAPLLESFRKFAEAAHSEGDSRLLSLKMSLGHTRRDATLNKDSILYLLEQINIDSGFVKEIRVDYKHGTEEKLDFATLKDTKLLLSHNCTCVGSQVAPQELLNNFDGAIENRIREITSHMRVFNQDKRQYDGGDIHIVVNV